MTVERGKRRDESGPKSKLESNGSCSPATQYRLTILRSISEVTATEWNLLARQGSASPFLEHDWLRCLEDSGCACQESGWLPYHMAVRDINSKKLVAAAPTYIKLRDSSGEFVFDSQFAEFAYSLGVPYFPKMLVGVPFTPASGRRLLTRSDDERVALVEFLAKGIIDLSEQMGLQSVHINFLEHEEVAILESCDTPWIWRLGVQYQWVNKGYDSFDDFLQKQFNSKKRIKLRRERTKVKELGIKMRILAGEDISASKVRSMFRIYVAGIEKQVFWGRQYLNRGFFDLLSECPAFRKHLLFIEAVDEISGSVIAGTFNVLSQSTFYGRYWGSPQEIESGAPIPNLHFETCYYSAIETAIGLGLSRVEPGAGGGESKQPRGFNPTPTYSAHWFADPRLRWAIGRYISEERHAIQPLIS